MECENVFCAYYLDGICTLKEISLDAQGHCLECLYIRLTARQLEKARKTTLRHYEKEYDRWP